MTIQLEPAKSDTSKSDIWPEDVACFSVNASATMTSNHRGTPDRRELFLCLENSATFGPFGSGSLFLGDLPTKF